MEKLLGLVALCAIGTFAVYVYLRKKSSRFKVINIETINTTLTLDDVVAFFKTLPIKKDVDIPFAANGSSEEFRKMLHIEYPQDKEGYHTIFIGVYNESENIKYHKLIYTKAVDEKLNEMFGTEKLIVLT